MKIQNGQLLTMQNSITEYNYQRDSDYYYKSMTSTGKFLYYTKAAKFYYNGDGMGFRWRLWNPITWALLPPLIMLYIGLYGVVDLKKNKHDIGISMNPFFKKNPEQLNWFKR